MDEAPKKEEKVSLRVIEDEMKDAYMAYAMSVIVGRALPSAKDGLKPVHRRILYAMHDLGMRHNQPYKKSARIVGEVLGKYHPHGDQAVYDSMVRMVQDFSLRNPLIDGQGNWGCFTADTKVQLADGRQLSFSELVDEHEQGKTNYTFTVNNGLIEVAKIINPRKTRIHAELITVVLDNGEHIRCTPDHNFLLKTGVYVEAKNLKPGISLMPCYLRESTKEDDLKPEIVGYPLVFQPLEKEWVLVHHLADAYNLQQGVYNKSAGRVRHHKDFDKQNNNPENIIRMHWKDHWKLHSNLTKSRHETDSEYVKKLAEGRAKYWANPENRRKNSERLAKRNEKNWKNPVYREKMIASLRITSKTHIKNNPHLRKVFSQRISRRLKRLWKTSEYRSLMNKKIIKANKARTTNMTGKKKFLSVCKTVLEKQGTLNAALYEEYRNKVYPYGMAPHWHTAVWNYYNQESSVDILNDACENHKVAAVYMTEKREDVYDLTVDTTHNFALAAGVFVHNSVDGDSAAAMRYTEARLAKISQEMLEDLDKETVEWTENFDGTLKEPLALPAVLPNLLVNGSSGIAVGMATNMPPHNLVEVASALKQFVDNPDISIAEIMEILPGPDFPTGGIICGRAGILHAYQTGKGRIILRGVIEREERKGKLRLIITEIPYQVIKSTLIEQIADLVRDKRVEGISDLRDESDRTGMRVVIELKRDANPEVIENNLYKYSRLQQTFGVINLALVNGEPRVLSLPELLSVYVNHRIDVITRRTQFELRKAQERAHVLEGLLIALKNIDAIVPLIRASKDVDAARNSLIQHFTLTDIQANAILAMTLAKLTNLESDKILSEHKDLLVRIADFEDILEKPERVKSIIKEDLTRVQEIYGNPRKTRIMDTEMDIDIEDLIDEEEMVVTISHEGYIKRLSLDTYQAQRRGGVGIIGATTKEGDFVEHLFVASTHSYLLFFSDKGKVYWKKVYQIPESGRAAKGTPVVNMLAMEKDERISAVISVREFPEDRYLVFATKRGYIKKTALIEYSRPRQGGIHAIKLDDGDDLVRVVLTDGKDDLLLASKHGQAIRFSEADVRPMGRVSRGVTGMRFRGNDQVLALSRAAEGGTVFTVTKNGFGKRTTIDEYRQQGRGGYGVRNIIVNSRNGEVAAVRVVDETDELLLISHNGIIIRTPCKDISSMGRSTQGVRIMRLRDSDSVSNIAKVVNEE